MTRPLDAEFDVHDSSDSDRPPDALRVLVVAHHVHPEVPRHLRMVAGWLSERGHECWMPPGEAEAHGVADAVGGDAGRSPNLVLTLGGDGTVLRAVRMLDGDSVPVLGVNLGRLGYLTEIEPEELAGALERYVAGPRTGRWSLDRRMMLDVAVHDASGRVRGRWRALNEAVIEKRKAGHTISVVVRIDSEPFTSYAADGIIVATPTGSTAYSFSVRGPIVSPKHRALLVTAVAPHMLFDRSLVLDPSELVEIELLAGRSAAVVIDGQAVVEVDPGSRLSCAPAADDARFVRFAAHRYHQVLKAKFGLLDR